VAGNRSTTLAERENAHTSKRNSRGASSESGRSAGKKRGLFHRSGVVLPATGLALLLVAAVWGGVKVMDPGGNGATSLFGSIDGLGNSKSVASITTEFNNIIEMRSASQVLTVAAAPAHADPDQIMADADVAEGGGADVASVAAPNNVAQNQQDAKNLMPSFGFSVASQWSCLDDIWQQESSWNVYAENAASGAYGIPQSLPADKMAVDGEDWATDPITQIEWGLGYIQSVYGTPCAAWAHEEADGFY
jgi:Transglycosylase SLT domain